LALPGWTKSLSREAQDKIQARAKKSLLSAIDQEREYEMRLKTVKKVFPGGQGIQESTTSSDPWTEVKYRY